MSRYRSHSRSPEPASADFHFTRGEGSGSGGGADSASGGSGGSGLECLQLRSPPGPFHYLISEQAKSFVALQELQNEVGALLEFRDLVMETFPTLRHKLPAAPGARDAGADWEPGVRVRRKLASGAGSGPSRSKPQPSVQDSGFSTETSCKSSGGGGAGSGAGASGPPALEDELWALLDVIQRKGSRLRDDAELLRLELERAPAADEWFGRAIAAAQPCAECVLRKDLEAAPKVAFAPKTPLGRLDQVLATPPRPPRVRTPDSSKIAAILRETNHVELQRHLLQYTVHAQALEQRVRRVATQRGELLDKLRRATELNDDLRFQLEEKSIELEGARAQLRLAGVGGGAARDSMRDLTPLALPPADASPPAPPASAITDTPKRTRRSRIPLPGHKARAPSAPPAPAPAPASYRSRSGEGRKSSCVPVRRPSSTAATDEAKVRPKSFWNMIFSFKEANSS